MTMPATATTAPRPDRVPANRNGRLLAPSPAPAHVPTMGDRLPFVASRVPAEFIGKARALRERIARAAASHEVATERIIAPLRPRPAWPTPDRPEYLAGVAKRYRACLSPARLCLDARAEGRALHLHEVVATADDTLLPGWGGPEPALALLFLLIETPPFRERGGLLAVVGLHALARRFQRGSGGPDGVLRDLRSLALQYGRCLGVAGDEFEAPCGGGRWIGPDRRGRGQQVPDVARSHLCLKRREI
jgi:hypothetical protein